MAGLAGDSIGAVGGAAAGANFDRIMELMSEKQREDEMINEILKDWKMNIV